MTLCIESRDVALGVLDLTCDAKEFGCGAFPGDGGMDLAMIVQQTLESFGVAAFIGLYGTGHEQREMLLLDGVASEVRVDALGEVAEEGLDAGRWIELLSFLGGIGKCGIMAFLRALTGLLRALTGGVRVVKVDFTLDDACFELIELGVEDANLAEVAAFEGLELGTELGEL